MAIYPIYPLHPLSFAPGSALRRAMPRRISGWAPCSRAHVQTYARSGRGAPGSGKDIRLTSVFCKIRICVLFPRWLLNCRPLLGGHP